MESTTSFLSQGAQCPVQSMSVFKKTEMEVVMENIHKKMCIQEYIQKDAAEIIKGCWIPSFSFSFCAHMRIHSSPSRSTDIEDPPHFPHLVCQGFFGLGIRRWHVSVIHITQNGSRFLQKVAVSTFPHRMPTH